MYKKVLVTVIVILSCVIVGELILIYIKKINPKPSNTPTKVKSVIPTLTATPEELEKQRQIERYENELLPRLKRNGVLKSNTQEGTIITTVYESTIYSLDVPTDSTSAKTRDDWSIVFKVGEEKPLTFTFDAVGFSRTKVFEKINDELRPISLSDLKKGELVNYTVKNDITKPPDYAFLEGTLIRISQASPVQ